MKKIEAISFDLDDTLWPVFPVINYAQDKIKKYILYHFDKFQSDSIDNEFQESLEKIRDSRPDILYNLTELRRLSFEDMLDEYGYDKELSHDLIKKFLEFRNEVKIFPDVYKCLEILSRTYKIASLTNGYADVRRLSIGRYFDAHISAEEVGVKKPDNKMFATLSDNLEVSPENILHVGDHPKEDVIGAQEAGLQSVWMNRFQNKWPLEEKVPLEVCSLNQLINFMQYRIF